MATESRTGIDEFRSILSNYGRIFAWALASSIAPVLAGLTNLAPPWPPSVIQVTAIAELLALIISFQFLKAASMKRINRIIISGIAILTVMLVLYLFAISQFVYEEPLSKLRFVKGFVCTPEAIQVFPGHCPSYSDDELRQAEWEAARLWTLSSITLVRLGLVCLWFAFFASLAVTVGSFLVYQGGRRARQ